MHTTYIIIGVIVLILGGLFYMKKNTEHALPVTEKNMETEISYEISPEDVIIKINNQEPVTLLDVRTEGEYAQLHLKNSLLIPVQTLTAESLANIGLGADAKNKEIILYCHSGNRSKVAYDIMKSLGYTNVKSIAGGMANWQSHGYPYTEIGG